MNDVEQLLERWQTAEVIDRSTAERIRNYEQSQEHPSRARWQVVLALSFGAILLGGGILLFVAAHWDTLSPWARFTLVLSMLALLHGLGVYFGSKSPNLSTALHFVGTVAAGAAIALTGQIFNINEHWPGGILLWALCSTAGYFWLRDGLHEAFTWMLWPAWLICEWSDRGALYKGGEVYLARTTAILAAVYLTAFLKRSQARIVRGVLQGVGALALAVSLGMLSNGWIGWDTKHDLPWSIRIFAFVLMSVFVACGMVKDRLVAVPAAVVFLAAMLLPMAPLTWESRQRWWSCVAYAIMAAVAAFFAWWGVHRSSRALVNLGMAGFALTVLFFYTSSVMDKLGRSLGLIALGVLFLAGGWALEHFRRDLVSAIQNREEAA